jgi:hypothetical protein
MVGVTFAEGVESVALCIGGPSYIYVSPNTARQIARQILLCADDVEQSNKPQHKAEVKS